MNIYPLNNVAFQRSERDHFSRDHPDVVSEDDHVQTINLQQELNDAAEEMAELLSSSGRRLSKAGQKNDNTDIDYGTTVLEENADENFDVLVRQVPKLQNYNNILNFARNLFPNDSDLMLVLRELIHSRKLSESQKKKVKEAIVDLEKFGDMQKIQSGINVGNIATKFSGGHGEKHITPSDLRNAYLLFLEFDSVPVSYIYQGWIKQYGFRNRKRILSFMLSALIADTKANEPGVHFHEFGLMSSKLSDARFLHSLDELVIRRFLSFPFWNQMRNLEEQVIADIYMMGLIDSDKLKESLQNFSFEHMPLLTIKQQAKVMQTFMYVFNLTPAFLYSEIIYRDIVLEIMISIMTNIYKVEINYSILEGIIE